VGPQADVYGLGAILYETLIGRPPFKELNEADTLRRLLVDVPIPPRRLRSDLPIDLEAVCLKCLEKRPADRYAAAAEMFTGLHGHTSFVN
jgi:serine/threonine protein kinase